MKNKKMLGILGIGAAALVGASFAYYTQSDSVDNVFKTAKYDTIVTEDFKPKDGEDWIPGEEVNKDVIVENGGDRSIVVRVKFEDIWEREGLAEPFHVATASDAFQYEQIDPNDGLTSYPDRKDKSVVIKTFAEESQGRWSEIQEDGWYYYLKKLEKGDSTGVFLDKVQLDPNVDFGQMLTQVYYATVASPADADWKLADTPSAATAAQITPEGDWTYTKAITEANEEALGYSKADYTLRITVQSVQATDGAVATVFKSVPETIVTGWELEKENLQ